MFSREKIGRQLTFAFVAVLLCGTGHVQGACFRGRPLPECKTFWITESGVLARLDRRTAVDWHEQLYYTFELGKMFNHNQRSAYGGTVLLGFDDLTNDFRTGFKVRYRRWLSKEVSLDLSPGILLDAGPSEARVFTTSIAGCFQDRIALTCQMDIFPWLEGPEDVAWYGGIKLGSEVGLVTAIAAPIIALIIFASNFDAPDMGGMHW